MKALRVSLFLVIAISASIFADSAPTPTPDIDTLSRADILNRTELSIELIEIDVQVAKNMRIELSLKKTVALFKARDGEAKKEFLKEIAHLEDWMKQVLKLKEAQLATLTGAQKKIKEVKTDASARKIYSGALSFFSTQEKELEKLYESAKNGEGM
ncbi:hypothetical protein ACFL2B_01475 [Patescibacteria group bacterium]